MEIEGYIELTARVVPAPGDVVGYDANCIELKYSAKGATAASALRRLKADMAASLSYMHREEELVDLLNWRGLPVTLARPHSDREVAGAPGEVVCRLIGTLMRNKVSFDD